jgi:hypothetical protein
VEGEAPTARRLIDAERRVHRILRARFAEELLELGVSFAQLEVMELLHGVDKLHPGEIGRRLLITRQSAAHLLHQLERAGLADTWPLDGARWEFASHPTDAAERTCVIGQSGPRSTASRPSNQTTARGWSTISRPASTS